MFRRLACALSFVLFSSACNSPSPQTYATAEQDPAGSRRLPTGARLDPAGSSYDLGSMPLAMLLSPEKDRLVVLLNGWREQGIQIVERSSGRVTQTVKLPAVFLGLAFSPDGKSLYVSGGNEDLIYRFDWSNGVATLADSIRLALKVKGSRSGTRYPAGIAISRDGRTLYAAENLADSLAVIDLASRRVTQRLPTDLYPYGVVVGADGSVYVSAWGGWTVSIFSATADGALSQTAKVRVGRHPSALALDPAGTFLFVASGSTDKISIVSTQSRSVVGTLDDGTPAATGEGSTPNALALSGDGKRLFVAEADNNAVAVFDLSPPRSLSGDAGVTATLRGRIPVGWYPTALMVDGADLFVANGKGRGTGPNPRNAQPLQTRVPGSDDYTLGQLSGTLTVLSATNSASELAAFSARVAAANGWTAKARPRKYPPFEHVIYIIKENRSYDQVLGDLEQGDGDSSLVFFPRSVSPNHHAIAERFGLFDRFFVNAEASPDGHNWSTAAYVTDYSDKTIPSSYSSRGRTYDYEGYNRDKLPEDDVAEPSSGYLWNLADRAGITYRNYGEYIFSTEFSPNRPVPAAYVATKPTLQAHTNPKYPGFNLSITDQHRVDIWLAEFQEYVSSGTLPRLEIVRLPNDHTSGASPGRPTPRAAMADNDLALGRIIEALSRSRFWKSTVVFVLEDDSQSGPDHVDSHRSVLLVISAYNRPGVSHRFANTTDVLATIEDILGLGRMSQFDNFGRPLREIWANSPDLTPYAALTPAVPLDEMNPKRGALAEASKKLVLDVEDRSDDDVFNRILWRAIKGNAPYPGAKRMSALDARLAR